MAKRQPFNSIDLDITHYDTDELLAMFNLSDPTEDDIVRATTRLINKATSDRLPKVAAFFQQAQDALQRYGTHQLRLQQAPARQAQRLEEKARAKLADLPAHTQLTEPDEIEKKRAVIEAALARAKARRAMDSGA